MDKAIIIFTSLLAVCCARALFQLIVTKCMKKDPWDALTFPNWEGPLLLVHWFGMCDSLTTTLGRPCPLWLAVTVALIFFGPICFLLWAFWQITRNVRKGLMVYEEIDRVSWKMMRENMKEAKGLFAKLGCVSAWLHAKRHSGEWSEHTKEGKFWGFLVKDLKSKAWKYFAWLLVRKFLLAATMALTIVLSTRVVLLFFKWSICLLLFS